MVNRSLLQVCIHGTYTFMDKRVQLVMVDRFLLQVCIHGTYTFMDKRVQLVMVDRSLFMVHIPSWINVLYNNYCIGIKYQVS